METLALLEETVPTLGRDGAGPAMKVLMPAIVKATDDADGKVRERAIGAIAAFGRACGGMASIGKYVEKMDEKKKKQIEEGVGKVRRDAAAAPAAAPAATAPPKKQALAPRDINAGTGGSKQSSPPPKKRSASAVGPKKTGTKKAEVENEENLEAGNFSPEEIEERVGEVVGAQTVANLKSANWKERLEGAEAFLGKVEEMGEGVDPHCEMIIRFLAPLITPEKNMQVTTKIIEVVTVTARNGMTFSRRDAHQSIEPVGVQMASHIRARIPCSTCLSTLCEAVGAGFVLKHLLPKAAKDKNPKVLSESLTWAATTVEEFGLAGVDVKGILKELKEALSSAVAPTRTAATKVLGAMHVYLGAGIKDFLSDVKPALMTSIETEFQKMPHNPSQTPTRTVRQKKRAAAAAGGGDENAVEVEEEEDAGASGGFGLPAEDISGKMTPQLMKELGAADWKLRTAAMDQVDQILVEANRRIGPDLGHDLLVGLKGRLADTNRNLAGQSVTLFAALAQAMGSPIERQTRGYMPEILKLLSDNKKQVRDSVVKSLDVWAVAIGIDKVTGHIAAALAEAKCSTDGKMEGSQWLAANLQPGKEAKEVMKVVAMDLKDKDSKVRDAGTKLLEQMLASCGHDAVAAAARSLKTADKTLVDPVLAKMGMSASAAMPAASKPNLSATAPAGSRPTSKVGSRPGSRGATAALSRSTSEGIRRPGSAAAPMRASAAGALGASRPYGAPANDGPLLTMMDHKEKEKRAKANRGTKTIYEDPRPEAAEELKVHYVKNRIDWIPATWWRSYFYITNLIYHYID
jgi:cytoskeleton-associated protein 5